MEKLWKKEMNNDYRRRARGFKSKFVSEGADLLEKRNTKGAGTQFVADSASTEENRRIL